MSIPGGTTVPGSGNYNTSRGNGGVWGGVKDIFSGIKATVTSTGGGTITYGGFTYIWGDGQYNIDPSQRAAASASGQPMTLAGTAQQAGFEPQYALYAVVGAVILYFMVKS